MKPDKENFVQSTIPSNLVGYDVLLLTHKKFFTSKYVDLLQQDVSDKENFIYFYEFKARKRKRIQPVSDHKRLFLLYITEGTVDSYIHGFGEIQFREGFCYLLYMPAEIVQKSYIKKGITRLIHLELNPHLLSELAHSHTWLNVFLEKFNDHSTDGLVQKAVRITPEMVREIDRIKNYEGNHGDFEYFLKVRTRILLLEYVLNASNDIVNIDGQSLSEIDRVILASNSIDKHEGKKLSISEICRIAGLSRKHLQAGFKRLHGVTADKYQTRVRVERAENLLVQKPGLSINEVAEVVGYSEASSFTKVFKAHNKEKLTPLRYRKKYVK